MNTNIIRQILDIQTQAERLISNKADLPQIEEFAKYNDELKSFLLTKIKDNFILNYIKEIPTLNPRAELFLVFI
ncbi:hypothetical protein [Abyssalbus ytuae]|uniref:Uncharacterized protein n=1 Tax=Abyssalbus ytuae TaxID=2926907 RepID=A0A9E7A317_9FLAO|nr:hypothetical protein [Abyssalbus ytuae]UOB18936.1 hypothetical protein MQE35_06485 [Abyssalbus ytuae]